MVRVCVAQHQDAALLTLSLTSFRCLSYEACLSSPLQAPRAAMPRIRASSYNASAGHRRTVSSAAAATVVNVLAPGNTKRATCGSCA